MVLTVLRDLREARPVASPEELVDFETDVLAGFVLARASAGLADGTIRGDVGHLDQVRAWLDKPLWDMEPADADRYFGRVLRGVPSGTSSWDTLRGKKRGSVSLRIWRTTKWTRCARKEFRTTRCGVLPMANGF